MRVKLDRILCTTDLSDFSNFSLPYGIAMAEEFGARLYVCHVIEMHIAGLYGEAYMDPIELQARQADLINAQFHQMAGDRDIDWEPLMGFGYPPDEIARLAEEHRIDLVISATHGRSGIKRLILGSVTERLMRILPCPLLVVISQEKAVNGDPDAVFGIRRLMVGCDFSPNSSLALHYALSFAQEFQAELHLVHVMETLPSIDSYKEFHSIQEKKPDARYVERTEARLNQMIPREALNWCEPVTAVLSGRPDEELARYAALHGIDMAFLGVRGRGFIETLIVGSTTDRVVRHAPCPVLSARPVVHAKADPEVAEPGGRGVETDLDGNSDTGYP